MAYSDHLDYEDDDREERSRAGQLQGVCKDCGNGTLNNDLNTAFKCNEDDALVCTNCGGTHLDLL